MLREILQKIVFIYNVVTTLTKYYCFHCSCLTFIDCKTPFIHLYNNDIFQFLGSLLLQVFHVRSVK